MFRFMDSTFSRTLLVLVVIGCLAGAAVAAERNVLGEYFTATW